jgi:hypothetical protein
MGCGTLATVLAEATGSRAGHVALDCNGKGNDASLMTGTVGDRSMLVFLRRRDRLSGRLEEVQMRADRSPRKSVFLHLQGTVCETRMHKDIWQDIWHGRVLYTSVLRSKGT